MQTLRRARFLARLVLTGFALALGAAIASPIVQPKAMELVCAADGVMKWVAQEDGDAVASHAHSLDCPLCVQVLTPPAGSFTDLAHAAPQSIAPRRQGVARMAQRAAAPLPPRGPPASP
ncbi:hypothetical protein AZ34_17660 [Hylemonella gracilis str. Niagara R]|uniref:DUF2946 domain-containing protein n=1 Tax=Hylemonella gracilis str. Niagara R TaxID=1458275 RepID=A0A016XLJ5_9BURK|nr:DUF2946 family protein [Hylemonella gracilis]EYC52711.1 hypothetical protein AZ34_17660 [Hylemonella gracilis str. Niagara R]